MRRSGDQVRKVIKKKKKEKQGRCGHRSIFGRRCSMCYAHGISSFSDPATSECHPSVFRSTLGQTTSNQNTQSSIYLVFFHGSVLGDGCSFPPPFRSVNSDTSSISQIGILAANLYIEQFEVQKVCNLNAAATSFQRHVLRGRASHRVS